MVFVSSIDFFYPTGMVDEFMYVTDDLDERTSGTDAEIMQYIELKDKNQKEIYEGDICRTFGLMDNVIGKIVLENYCWMLLPKGWNSGMRISNGLVGHLEIISNIHENSELLEK